MDLKSSAPAASRRRAPSTGQGDDNKSIVVRRRSSKKSQEKRQITVKEESDTISSMSDTPKTRARASTIDTPMRAPLAASHQPVSNREAPHPQPRISVNSHGSSNWISSPSADPGAKIFEVHSRKDLGQILDNLRLCFNDMSLEVVEKKTSKTGSLKVKGKLASSRQGKNVVKVNIQTTEDGGTSLEFKKSGRSSRDEFQGVIKKLEETLSV